MTGVLRRLLLRLEGAVVRDNYIHYPSWGKTCGNCGTVSRVIYPNSGTCGNCDGDYRMEYGRGR